MKRTFYNSLRLCFFLALLLGSRWLYAQHEPVYTTLLQGDSIYVGKTLTVQDTVFFDPVLKPTVLRTNRVDNIITFRINELSTKMLPDSFTAFVRCRLYYTDKDNLQDSLANDTLRITYHKDRTYQSRVSHVLKGAYLMQVKILEVNIQQPGGGQALLSLELENRLVIDRDFEMSCTDNAIQSISKDTTTIAVDGELRVSWTPDNAVEKYDLEWTYIDKSALDAGIYNTSGNPDPVKIFRNNATRVTIAGSSYMIPMLYDGYGSLFFRVRGVQQTPDGELITTDWSSEYVGSGGLGRYDFNGHERKLNWQASVSFAEDGKRKAVVQYFDGSLMNRQTVTKDNTTGTTVVAETLYDKQGRPVIQVMPAPTLSKLIKYTPAFNVYDMNSREYDKGIYDTLLSAADYCTVPTDTMSVVSGASRYYSPLNEKVNESYHKYIPDAKGYAFSATQYTQDNTGRIKRQGGVGEEFRLGGGHETRYYYGSATQEDLDALFGTEAGDASHYAKNMVRDANGQYSVSYIDMHGRTIATALAGNAPGSLQQLASYRDSVQTFSLLTGTNNIILGNSIQSTSSLLMPREDTVQFTYGLAAESLTLEDCDEQNICYDCLYDLTITITDDCNNQLLPDGNPLIIRKSNFRLFEVDTTCDTATPVDTTFKVRLKEGSYTVTKTLSISQYAMNYYRDSLFLPHNTCKTFADFYQEQLDSIKNRLDCSDPEYRQPTYLSHLDQMLQDLVPLSGQYADRDPATLWPSIFNYNSLTNKYAYQEVGDTGVYRNEAGQPDFVYNSAGVLVSPAALTPEEFIANFKDSWTVALLSRHPEFCLWKLYAQFADSHIWDDNFRSVETYAEALTKGYLNPTGNSTTAPANQFTINLTDPLYSHAQGAAALAPIEDSLFTYKTAVGYSPLSLWGFATLSARCPDPITSSCANFWNTAANVFETDSLCIGELDMAWRIFRDLYLEEKREWIDKYMRAQCLMPYPELPLVAVFPRRDLLLAEIGLGEGVVGSTAGQEEEQAFYASNCAGYIEYWKEKLSSCGYTTPQMNVITTYLKEICIQGSDAYHPAGSSSVKPGSTYRFANFDEAIQFVNDSIGRANDASCNAFLIDRPQPYSLSGHPLNQPIISKPDSCQCAKLNGFYTSYTSSGSPATFSAYLNDTHNISISQGNLDTLRGLCNNTITCRYIPQIIMLPPSLQCGVNETCVDCITFKPVYDSFVARFPGVVPVKAETDSTKQQANALFANYMNTHLGIRKTAFEYLAFKDSCVDAPIPPMPGDTTLNCNNLSYFLVQFYHSNINPFILDTANYVDLDMRTLAGNKTPAEGPKGVFDVNGNLIGNTVDGTLSDIRTSYASVWNSSTANQAVGTLSVLESGKFRLTLNEGQTAPCSGIIGMRFYKFDAHPLDSTAGNFRVGEGSYVDFGDSTRLAVPALPTSPYSGIYYTDARNSIRGNDFSTHFGDNTYYMPGRTPVKFFLITHKYFKPLATRQTYTVTVYHTDKKGVVSFYGPRTDVADPATTLLSNLRGYFPQQTLSLDFFSTQDSTICRTSQIKNFDQITSIERFEISNRPEAVFQVNLGSMANNHDMQYLWFHPQYSVIPSYTDSATLHALAGKPFHHVFPDLHTNFPKIGYMQLGGWNNREHYYDSSKYELPLLRHFALLYNDSTFSYQIDTIVNQVARVNNQTNGTGMYLNIPYTGAPTSASLAARTHLTSNNFNWGGVNYPSLTHVNTTTGTRILDAALMMQTNAFTDYVNEQLGTNYTYSQLQSAYASGCFKSLDYCAQPDLTNHLLCNDNSGEDEIPFVYNAPCADSTLFAFINASELYRIYLDSLKNSFNEAYIQKCLQAINLETFTVTKPVTEYHYTLYYYDLAGNLVKTIPPEGVRPNRDPVWLADVKVKRAAGLWKGPEHGLLTTYRYNSLNLPVTQKSPDGGLSKFWYDRLGRLAVSQNAKQLAASNYTYTKYDVLGRITEGGEKRQATSMTQTISCNRQQLLSWMDFGNINSNLAPKQVIVMTYDVPSNLESTYAAFTAFRQKKYTLRDRVSYTRLFEAPTYLHTINGSDTSYVINDLDYDAGSEYSYDIHGNVDSSLNLYGDNMAIAGHGGNRFKLMTCQYDLISGKINQVHYQPGKNDELYHRYEYNADNKLTNVYITDNKALIGQPQLEEHDARYQYYKHGPWARTVLGEQQVQGMDYAYTLQGWFKGINSTSLSSSFDMGGDGLAAGSNQLVAKDVYGFNLNYFTGDYSDIGAAIDPFPRHSENLPDPSEYRPLYNGNVSSMAINTGKFNQPQLYNYRYDQLNRIKAMDVYRGFDQSNNNWWEMTDTEDYRERVSYDGNGNILTYLRNGTTAGGNKLGMDSLTYGYSYSSGMLQHNRLRHVKDDVKDGNYTVDIDEQEDDNYSYDAIGNLVYDVAEGIDKINWTVYGKIASITKGSTTISYKYDVDGNRIEKRVVGDQTIYTHYVRDGLGNVMAVYEQINDGPMKLVEQHLYGSKRIGLWRRDQDIDVEKPAGVAVDLLGQTNIVSFERGSKLFELSNHLGNVLVTISDKKLGVDNEPDGTVDYYMADVMTANDYYPFGMGMPERKYSASDVYRYGFNGKENDNDVKGEGNQQDYGMRIYDLRLGKFLSVDPLTKGYPWYTPYQYAGNKPIWAIDLDGAEERTMTEEFATINGVVLRTSRREDYVCPPDITCWNRRYNFNIDRPRQKIALSIVADQLKVTPEIHDNGLFQFWDFPQTPEKDYASYFYTIDGVTKRIDYSHEFLQSYWEALPEVERKFNAAMQAFGSLLNLAVAGSLYSAEMKSIANGLKSLSSESTSFTVRLNSAEAVNAEFVGKGYYAPYRAGTIAELEAPTNINSIVRLSGAQNVPGEWFTTLGEIKGLTPQQLKDKFSLKYAPTHQTMVTIPQGTTIRIGTASAVEGFNTIGGGFQIQVLKGPVQYGTTTVIK